MLNEHIVALDGVAVRARIRSQSFQEHGLKVIAAELDAIADEIDDILEDARRMLPRATKMESVRDLVSGALVANRDLVDSPESYAETVIGTVTNGGYSVHPAEYVAKLVEENDNYRRHTNLKAVGRVGEHDLYIIQGW